MATTNTTNVNFVKVSTQEKYNDLTKQDGTIYFVVSEKKIYLDGVGYGISDEDAANFISIDGGTIYDGSLIIRTDAEVYPAYVNVINDRNIEFIYNSDGITRRIAPYSNTTEDRGILIQAGETTYNFAEGKLYIVHGQGDAPVVISGVADPVDDDDATNKAYVDQEIATITDMIGANGGLATLDAGGKVPQGQLPSYVDDVVEGANQGSFPATGETGKIYVSLDNNKTWRWSGSGYTEISSSLALGETSSTAYYGDKGKAAYDHISVKTGNPHSVTKANVGLGSVENYAVASQAEAEAGTSTGRYMTPLRTKQAIEKLAPKLTWTVVA